jgi:hypothetical protein
MASNDTATSGDAGSTNIVEHERIKTKAARNELNDELTADDMTVSWERRRQLAKCVADYYDALWDYAQDNQAVQQAWQDSDIDQIQELKNSTVSVPVEAPGRTSNTRTAKRNALATVDPGKLEELSKQLDVFAKALGLTHQDSDEGRPRGMVKADGVDDE